MGVGVLHLVVGGRRRAQQDTKTMTTFTPLSPRHLFRVFPLLVAETILGFNTNKNKWKDKNTYFAEKLVGLMSFSVC